MIDVRGDLWTFPTDWICITTNGVVSRSGAAVMGAGCARQARDRFDGLDHHLGAKLRAGRNHTHYLGSIAAGAATSSLPAVGIPDRRLLFSFPVKHHWKEAADLTLIERSAGELRALWIRAAENAGRPPGVILPRPGCGNGQLRYEDVRPVLERALPEEVFRVITYAPGRAEARR